MPWSVAAKIYGPVRRSPGQLSPTDLLASRGLGRVRRAAHHHSHPCLPNSLLHRASATIDHHVQRRGHQHCCTWCRCCCCCCCCAPQYTVIGRGGNDHVPPRVRAQVCHRQSMHARLQRSTTSTAFTIGATYATKRRYRYGTVSAHVRVSIARGTFLLIAPTGQRATVVPWFKCMVRTRRGSSA